MAVTAGLVVTCLSAALWRTSGELLTPPSEPARLNSTSSGGVGGARNETAAAARISPLMAHLPALKNIVIVIFVLTAALIACLVIKVVRSGRRIRKTRKYDIITTPAERVEMAPLNEENDDEDDSTLFDVKYRHFLKDNMASCLPDIPDFHVRRASLI